MLTDPTPFVWNPDFEAFLSEKHRRVAELINEYDASLTLAFIPPKERTDEDVQPFAVVCNPDNGPAYIVRKCTPDEVDERLVAWIASNDTTRTDVLGSLEAVEAAKKLLEEKEQREILDEAKDIGTAIIKSPLNWYHHGGRVYK